MRLGVWLGRHVSSEVRTGPDFRAAGRACVSLRGLVSVGFCFFAYEILGPSLLLLCHAESGDEDIIHVERTKMIAHWHGDTKKREADQNAVRAEWPGSQRLAKPDIQSQFPL
jgi:hypothetical protein